LKTLIIGNIPNDFSPERHHPLGPWCFIGKEDFFPDWENISFEPDPFNDFSELEKYEKLTWLYCQKKLSALYKDLNNLNKTNYSKEFWRILILPWLLTSIHVFLERQLRVRQFLNRHENELFNVRLIKDNVKWKFKNTSDFFTNGVWNPVFNEWLYSRIFEQIIPASWEKQYYTPKIQVNYETNQKMKFKQKLIKIKQKLEDTYLLKLRCRGVYGINTIQAIFWSIYLSLLSKKSSNSSRIESALKETENLAWSFDFDSVLLKILPLCFKDGSIKNFKKPKVKPGKINLIGPILWYDEYQKLDLAFRIEGGEQIIVTQHGGLYGTLKSVPLISSIEYGYRKFFTWGWKNHQDYKGDFQALPSPYLLKQKKKKHCKNQLILVGYLGNLYSYRLDSTPQALQQIESRKLKYDFIDCLDKKIFEKLYYRPYTYDKDILLDKQYFLNKLPSLKILCGNLYKELLRTKLVVLDHPITTLHISLAANIPTIVFLNKNAWAMCRQAQPFFESLKEVGILFHSSVDAAQKVNEIWGDIEDWWGQPKIQIARSDWAFNYARVTKTWWVEWVKALRNF